MDYAAQENLVLRDWLSFTSQTLTPQEIIKHIGLAECPWTEIAGARGYKDRLYFGGISIHFNGREGMGTWCEMSGTGCRTFETYSLISWEELTDWLIDQKFNITRLDIAFDDHSGILDVEQVQQDTEAGNMVTRSDAWETIRSSKGASLTIGSPQSLFRLRIYDKAAERAAKLKGEEKAQLAGTHWVRVEMQLRDERAKEFLRLTQDEELGTIFAGVLKNYIRYVEPNGDSNKSRWPMTDYWQQLLGEVDRIQLFVSPGVRYNYQDMFDNMLRQYGCAIHTAMAAGDTVKLFDRAERSYQQTSEANRKKHEALLAERLKMLSEITGEEYDNTAV